MIRVRQELSAVGCSVDCDVRLLCGGQQESDVNQLSTVVSADAALGWSRE